LLNNGVFPELNLEHLGMEFWSYQNEN